MWARFTVAVSFIAALVVAVLAGCNNHHCEGNPHDDCRLMWDASGTGCTSNDQCMAPTAVCDVTDTKTCVQCIAPDQITACTGATPACGTDHMCHACTAHTDCASSACLPDGSCGSDTNVAYVDPAGTDNTMCTKAMPCTTVVKALGTNRPYVKFHGTTDEAVNVSAARQVTFLADPGAVLTRSSGSGPIVTVQDDNTSLKVFDLSISNAPNNSSGRGILIPGVGSPFVSLTRTKVSNNPGGGISASGGTLTVSQSTISANAAGGFSIAGTGFDITNNMIVQNGGPTSLAGGIDFTTVPSTGMHRLEFNTITANAGTSTVNSGVNCGTVGVAITFSNNIIYANTVSGGGKQIGGSANCSTTYSDIGPDTATGMGNINMDPQFANVVQSNFHINANSPCKDAADPAATLSLDFDGDARPQGARRDIGADEAP